MRGLPPQPLLESTVQDPMQVQNGARIQRLAFPTRFTLQRAVQSCDMRLAKVSNLVRSEGRPVNRPKLAVAMQQC